METNVMNPSGDPVFDRAVVTAAKDGTFSPERRNCTAVTGSYVFVVQTARNGHRAAPGMDASGCR